MDLSGASRTSFDPPPPRGHRRAFALALLVHVLLILALAWGLRWKKDTQDMAVEAELWAATAQAAAPQPAQVQPPPPPPPVVQPHPAPAPEPKPVPQVNDDQARQAELALEQQKKREEARRQEDERQRQAAAARAKAAAQQAAAEAAQKAAAQKAAAAKAAELRALADREAKETTARRQARMRDLTALASADQAGMANPTFSGQSKTSRGNSSRSAGPSAGYAARVRQAVFSNISNSDLNNIPGNPYVVVEVRCMPDGTITDRRLYTSSGVRSWDETALRAIDRTRVLPRDVDGRAPCPFTIGFHPQPE